MIIRFACFPFDEIPRFPCPRCGKGQLRILKDTIVKKHPAWITTLPTWGNNISYDENGNEICLFCQEDVIGNPDEEFITSFFLECDFERCREVVVASGLLKCDVVNDPNSPYDEYYPYNFYPTSFHPTVVLFEIPQKTPEKLKIELLNSFALFWISAPACGNAIRIAVERLMDERNIPLTKSNSKGKETTLTLHERIEKFGEDVKELSDLLLAIKWIGNDASHTSDLYHSDIVLAYELFEKCLVELFDVSKIERLKSSVNEINAQKKPISKIRKVQCQQTTEGQ